MTGLSLDFSLVQGPPGTGKTSTIAALCWQLVQLGRCPILVSAPANVTVEHLTFRIAELGLKVVRLAGAKSDRDPSVVRELTVYHIMLQMRGKDGDRFRELDRLRHTGTFDEDSKEAWFDLRWKLTRRISRQADIVCCTPDMAGAEEFSKLRFRYVICDEATQATEPQTILTFLLGAEHVVLVGDQCQLGPSLAGHFDRERGLETSLFQRLVMSRDRMGLPEPVLLQFQYRMHPAIAEWPSAEFYEGNLRNGVTVWDRMCGQVFPFPVGDCPIVFMHRAGGERPQGQTRSFVNYDEAALVIDALGILLYNGVTIDRIGVIAPYSGQSKYIAGYLEQQLGANEIAKLKIASVDRFQGSEKDFIILTCVRSNDSGSIGFMEDAKRVNVSLTRARIGLIIVGDAATLMRANERWRSFIRFADQKGVLVEGQDWYQIHRSGIVAEEERRRVEQRPSVQAPVSAKIAFTKGPERS
jgi:regulator of nonsense transcripts 1